MKNKIKELLKEIGGLSLHGHRNEGKWYGQEAELKDYEEFEELESLIEKKEKLLELYKEALETNFEGITLIKLVNKTLRTQIKELENDN